MADKFEEFKAVIAEIFEMDKSELDFGIYRILNQKSKEIQKFLDGDLRPQVKEALSLVSKELQEREANEIFSALAVFFKRYYEGGDFISKRRYKEGVYAIPYEGEEVKLYWANYDQYYIKTTENLSNFAFILPSGKRVNFQILEASVSKDNNKTASDKDRIFVLHKTEKIRAEENELFIPFEYALVDKKEKAKESSKEIANTIFKSKESKDFLAELQQKAPTEKNKERTFLEKQIEEFTARYNFDYFIHKNLGGFLRRELDFFIKNEILYIEDLDSANVSAVQSHITKVKTIKLIGEKIIAFLEQLENFQKKLWLKKKFITETQYCITLDRIPKTLYSQILENKAQIAEWEKLFSISERHGYTKNLKSDFLEKNLNLVLDTKFFSEEFKLNLISSIPNFDESCNGLLIHSENFQGLNLLQEKYREKVDAVYIDPPYNTDASEILYKNNYKHSSWNSLIYNAYNASNPTLKQNANILTTIDDVELKNLLHINNSIFGEDNFEGIIAIRINPSGRPSTDGIALSHEYAILSKKSINSKILKVPRSELQLKRFNEKDSRGIFEQRNFRREGSNSNREDGKRQFYPFFVNKKSLELRIPEMIWNNSNEEWILKEKLTESEIMIFPVNDEGIEKNWRWSWENVKSNYSEFYAKHQKNSIQIYYKYRPNLEGTTPLSFWGDSKYSATEYGTSVIKELFGKTIFPYAKSIYAVQDCLYIIGIKENYTTILDYFAGSGTTGHAVINLNREDGGNRKFILVEMGEYFETVLKPRIQKVIYASQWKDGKPQELTVLIDKLKKEKSELNKELNGLMGFQSEEEYEFQKQRLKGEIQRVEEQITRTEEDGKIGNSFGSVSHCFKYFRLESYEDALNNLSVEDKSGELKFSSRDEREEYMLKYVLDLETKDSQSLLNLDGFTDPFSYSMDILENGALKKKNMDLVETFHYLLGVNVKRYHRREEVQTEKTSFLVQCVEGELRSGEKILIVWRTVPEDAVGANKQLKTYLEKKFTLKDFDKLYINGDSIIENAELLEEHFHKAMFDVRDV